MIHITRGDILAARADALVNTVNCVGVMGRGIALQFKKAFPEVFKAYKQACDRGDLKPGVVLVHDLGRLEQPHFVISFPTKQHWRAKSRMVDIESGLDALVEQVQTLGIKSIAIPPLGCGLGGLEWPEVRARIELAFELLPEVNVLLFEPAGAPAADEMVKSERVPNMTVGRATLLGLMDQYLRAMMDPTITLLEIHKLMYFMQVAGQDLKLKWSKGPYGPYSENLRHVLNHIEGHFVSGFADAADRPEVQITPKSEAIDAARQLLGEKKQVQARLDRVADLIEGFETPFGMELLATIHWCVAREDASSSDLAVRRTRTWNPRKAHFSEKHILVAYRILEKKGWLATSS